MRVRLCFNLRLVLLLLIIVAIGPLSGRLRSQSLTPSLTVQAGAQTKMYGQPDPVFTYNYQGFVDGDTAAVLSGEPVVTAPQRVQNLWQFTESLPPWWVAYWQFSADGLTRQSDGIELSHITSAGNFYSQISATLAAFHSPIVYPGMQYLLSFYAVSNINSNQAYWHRALANGNATGWGPTAIGPSVQRIVFRCAGTADGALDCGSSATIPLGSGPGQTGVSWLFLGKNNQLSGADPSVAGFPVSVPADLYVGGFQMEPAITEKRGVLAMGDSLTQYDCSTDDELSCTSWTAFAASQLDVPVYNRGVAGQTCAQIQARWATDASPILAANAKYAIIFCGTNDISSGFSAAQTEQSIAAMTALATSDGATPVVATVGPFAMTVANGEATRQAINAWIRATNPLVLDFDKVNADPSNPAQQNPAYVGDGVHLNIAGRVAEGNYVAQSITGNSDGYPGIWSFQQPIPYQPVLGLNPSNGMDFHPGAQREAGSYIILPATGTLASSKYSLWFTSSLLTVAPAPLSVSANNKSMTYGTRVPVLDGTIAGTLEVDNISASYSTSATSTSAPGTYTITPTLLDPDNRLSNYTVTQSAGTLTIIPAPPPVVPTMTGLSPAYSSAGSAGLMLTITGTGFSTASLVHFGGAALATQFVSATKLTAQVPASALASSGVISIAVQDTANTSNTIQFEVDSSGASAFAPVFTPATASIAAGASATYAVALPSSAADASVACLNLPANAACAYATGALTIATSTTTPAGAYQVVVVVTETGPRAAWAWILFPFLLVPATRIRRRRHGRMLLLAILLAGFAGVGALGGCGVTPAGSAPTQQVTSSGVVMLNVH